MLEVKKRKKYGRIYFGIVEWTSTFICLSFTNKLCSTSICSFCYAKVIYVFLYPCILTFYKYQRFMLQKFI